MGSLRKTEVNPAAGGKLGCSVAVERLVRDAEVSIDEHAEWTEEARSLKGKVLLEGLSDMDPWGTELCLLDFRLRWDGRLGVL